MAPSSVRRRTVGPLGRRTEVEKRWGGERLLQPGRCPLLGEPAPLWGEHFKARPRCEANKPHTGGCRTTWGPKERRAFGANRARRPNHMRAEGPGTLQAKGIALVIGSPSRDNPFHSQSPFGPTGQPFLCLSQWHTTPVPCLLPLRLSTLRSTDGVPLHAWRASSVSQDPAKTKPQHCLPSRQAVAHDGLSEDQ
jgi:hypothetical protein